jgi:hypothetical protein
MNFLSSKILINFSFEYIFLFDVELIKF